MKNVKALDTRSLAELFDQRDTIQRAVGLIMNKGIPHQKKTIEAMRRGEKLGCRLTQGGKSCECREATLSGHATALRELDSAIRARVHPIVPKIADAQRDRLHMQAAELAEQARQLRIEAQQLDARVEALREQAKSDADRTIEANGHQFYLERTANGHRITAADRTALVSFGALGCCLDRIYERVSTHLTHRARVIKSSAPRYAGRGIGLLAKCLFSLEADGVGGRRTSEARRRPRHCSSRIIMPRRPLISASEPIQASAGLGGRLRDH